MLSNDSCPNTSGGLQGFTPGFTETLMYHWRYTLIFIPDFVPQECCKVKERHLCPWIKRNNLQNTFAMGQNDCLLFGIKFVFQGFSHRVTIPDILKLQVPHFFRPRAHPWPPKKEAFPHCKIVTYDAKILGGHGCADKSDKNQIVTLLHCTMNLQNVTILNRFTFWGANSTRCATVLASTLRFWTQHRVDIVGSCRNEEWMHRCA